jgi:RimJ/RimL family protein N-acetyltransferase
MDVITARLILHPLTPAESQRIVDGAPGPGDRWHAQYPLADELDPLRGLAKAERADPVFTLYQIRTAEDGQAIGGIGFFGPPSEDGSVELGYGIVPALRGHGIATEALRAMVMLALENGAACVKADTSLDNAPSQWVLDKPGFHVTRRDDQKIYYRHDGTLQAPRSGNTH